MWFLGLLVKDFSVMLWCGARCVCDAHKQASNPPKFSSHFSLLHESFLPRKFFAIYAVIIAILVVHN